MKDQFVPVAQEYSKRKGAIEELLTAQQSAMETAVPQPTAAKPLPSDLPEAKPFQLSPIAQMMDNYEQLRNQHDKITTELAAGPTLDAQEVLNQQRRQLEARMAELAPAIEERGGVTETQAEFEKKLKAADKERLKLLGQGDFDAADKLAAKIKDMQLRMPMFEELRLSREQAGQTRELFGGATPTKTEAQIQQEQQTLAEEKARALYGREAKKASAEQAFGEAGVGPRGQLEEAPAVSEPKAAQVIQPKQLEDVEKAKEQAATARQGLDEVIKASGTKDTDALYAALDKINEAETRSSVLAQTWAAPP